MKEILKKIKISSLHQEQKELNTLNLEFNEKSSEKININNHFFTPKNPITKKEPFLYMGHRDDFSKTKKLVDIKENNKTNVVEEVNLPMLNPNNMNNLPSTEPNNVLDC